MNSLAICGASGSLKNETSLTILDNETMITKRPVFFSVDEGSGLMKFVVF